MRHDEFSINIDWRKPEEGSWPRPEIEGFYLTMGWANEGEAEWLAERRLITAEQTRKIAEHIADLLVIPTTHFHSDIRLLTSQAEERRLERIRTLEIQRQRIDDELKAIDA